MTTANERRRLGTATYEEVMCRGFDEAETPFSGSGLLDFVFADLWNRPGLSRRAKRLVTLSCVSAADTQAPIVEHVYAALKSRDLSIDDMHEFVLHFAVYCGWPKASFLNATVLEQWEEICREEGNEIPSREPRPLWRPDLSVEERIRGGEECFAWINCVPAPPKDTAYVGSGILPFVFGEVWQRPFLSVRDRRFLTIAAVGLDDTIVPIRSHVYSGLKSGDVSFEELKELTLHFAAYAGWPKASFLNQVVLESWAQIEAEGGIRVGDEPVYHPEPKEGR